MSKNKSNRNNPDPIPFIKIKNEPIAHETNLEDSQNIKPIVLKEKNVQNHLNRVGTSPVKESKRNYEICVNIQLKKEKSLEEAIQLTNRVELLTSENELLKAENQNKSTKISELEKQNKEKSDKILEIKREKSKLLNEKTNEILVLREKIASLEEKIRKNDESYLPINTFNNVSFKGLHNTDHNNTNCMQYFTSQTFKYV